MFLFGSLSFKLESDFKTLRCLLRNEALVLPATKYAFNNRQSVFRPFVTSIDCKGKSIRIDGKETT